MKTRHDMQIPDKLTEMKSKPKSDPSHFEFLIISVQKHILEQLKYTFSVLHTQKTEILLNSEAI